MKLHRLLITMILTLGSAVPAAEPLRAVLATATTDREYRHTLPRGRSFRVTYTHDALKLELFPAKTGETLRLTILLPQTKQKTAAFGSDNGVLTIPASELGIKALEPELLLAAMLQIDGLPVWGGPALDEFNLIRLDQYLENE